MYIYKDMLKNIVLRNVMIKGNIQDGAPIEIHCNIRLDMLRPLDSTHAVQGQDRINIIAEHAVYNGFHGAIEELKTLLEIPIGMRRKKEHWMWYVFPTSSEPASQPPGPLMQVKTTEQDRYIRVLQDLNKLDEWIMVIFDVSQINELTNERDKWRLQKFLTEWARHLFVWFTDDVINRLASLSGMS